MSKHVFDIILGLKDAKLFKGVSRAGKAVGSFSKKSVKRIKAVGTAFKKLAKPVGIFSAAITAIGGGVAAFALKASGDIEMLKAQLSAVMPTAKAVKKAFKESMQYSVKTPFTPAEIVQTRIALEGVGIAGPEAVESISQAAAALDRNLLDVASAVISLETEPLRNLGIMLKRNGDEFVFTFKDKMGNAQKVVATSFEEAQQAALRIFNTRFSGGVEKMAATFKGLKSTLAGVRQLFFAELGDGFLPQAKQIVKDIIDLLNKGIDSGKINKIGEKIGAVIQRMRDDFAQIVSQIKSVEDLKAVALVIGDFLKEKLAAGGQLAAKFMAEKAPIIGDAIGRAAKTALVNLTQDSATSDQQRAALKEAGGVSSIFSLSRFNTYREARKGFVSENRQNRLSAEGKDLAGQIEISAASQQSLAERITTALADKQASLGQVGTMQEVSPGRWVNQAPAVPVAAPAPVAAPSEDIASAIAEITVHTKAEHEALKRQEEAQKQTTAQLQRTAMAAEQMADAASGLASKFEERVARLESQTRNGRA